MSSCLMLIYIEYETDIDKLFKKTVDISLKA